MNQDQTNNNDNNNINDNNNNNIGTDDNPYIQIFRKELPNIVKFL